MKRTKKLAAPSQIGKKWTKWLKLYRGVNACLENRARLEKYRDNLKKKLECAFVFEKEKRFRENAKHVIGDLFDECILRAMPSLKDELVFDRNRVIIEKLSEKSVRCSYSEGNVYILYEGKHTPVFNSSKYVATAIVDYRGARLFLMKNDNIENTQ